MTSSPPSLLALHIQRETRLWELQRNSSRPHTSTSTPSTIMGPALFSDAGAGAGDDDVDSISSLATTVDAEDPDELPQPQAALLALLHHNQNQQHIPVYASLDEAAAQSAIGQQGAGLEHQHQQPRRLTTPGKLYENEEDDDEIFEDEHEYGDDVVATG